MEITVDQALPLPASELLADYRLGWVSRYASIVGRREVLSGKAKFGIFGDGKELAQLALARFCQTGDWRSGYYRDQTWMFARGELTVEQYFAQLYADADLAREPMTGGRGMNGHFGSRLLDSEGSWLDQTTRFNSSSDVSPTASQFPRSVGLAYASVLYRRFQKEGIGVDPRFSQGGNEVTWVTIGNASTAEGLFWESVNAIGVLHAPAVITVYDDGYGISVPNQFQMVKENISSILEGFRRIACPAEECDQGFDLYTVPCWDYPELLKALGTAGDNARRHHIPALVHVTDCTQPLGHSTSGSQERYKVADRLEWEKRFDCLRQYKLWLMERKVATEEELDRLEREAQEEVEGAKNRAFAAYSEPILRERQRVAALLKTQTSIPELPRLAETLETPGGQGAPYRRDTASVLHRALVASRGSTPSLRKELLDTYRELEAQAQRRYASHLYSQSAESALRVQEVKPQYSDNSPTVMGFELMNAFFDGAFTRDPRLIAFGEDLGALGDVNQGFRGLQEKYGPYRIADTGIREATIVGQAIGLALRGLRPIAEIQYLDYLLYGLQILSDDLATLHWRTVGGQKAPVIIRTRGHRLEGVWHAGSPMGGIIHLVRGMHVLVPRDFTRAAGFYNTLLRSDEPAIVVEVLNGYRKKERLPDNLADITVPLGVPELLKTGEDLTVATYGATTRIVLEAAQDLEEVGIRVEVMDVQSLLPFDIPGLLGESVKKTGKLLVVDEDVPGGTGAYILQDVLERQGAFDYLDAPPRTLSAAAHRPAYGSDGDYWSKPNRETIFDAAYGMLREYAPSRFPALY